VQAISNTTQLAASAGITISPTIQLATPPAITQVVLLTLPFNLDNKFITSSSRLESFRINTSPTTFEVTYLSHEDGTNSKTASFNYGSGTWSYVASSASNLSCIIVSSSTMVTALRLDEVAGTLTNFSTFAISSLSSFSGAVIG
jgi:hypothetical protein